jgi:hypothetical protein
MKKLPKFLVTLFIAFLLILPVFSFAQQENLKAITEPATGNSNSVILNGIVNTNGDSNADVYFQYQADDGSDSVPSYYNGAISVPTPAGNADTNVSATITAGSQNLTPNTLYHFRLKIVGSDANKTTVVGTDMTFTPFTLTNSPNSPTDITSVGVTGFIAPAAGGIPQTSGTLSSGASTYTLTGLTWSPTDNPYQASTVYTATVILTSATGYEFPTGGIASITTDGGGTASAGTTNGTGSGNTLTFTVSFPAATTFNILSTCTYPNTLVNGVCTTPFNTPTTTCVAPNTLVNGVCTTPTSTPTTTNGLVPCGTIANPGACDFNALMTLVNKVISFVLFRLAVPIAAIMFVYAGFLLLTSGGEVSKKTKAKDIFVNVAIGLIIAAAAWLIVHTILLILGYTGSSFLS